MDLILEILSGRLLIRAGPVTVVIFYLAFGLGVMHFGNFLDALERGAERPPGYLAFWMVVLYDHLILPVAIYQASVFYQKTGLVNDLPSIWMMLVALAVAISAGMIFALRRDPNYVDWTVDEEGFNGYGLYHLVLLSAIFYFFALFILEGWQFLNGTADALVFIPRFVFVLVLLVMAPVIFLLMDEGSAVPKPTELWRLLRE